jgi:hypothetical protein
MVLVLLRMAVESFHCNELRIKTLKKKGKKNLQSEISSVYKHVSFFVSHTGAQRFFFFSSRNF